MSDIRLFKIPDSRYPFPVGIVESAPLETAPAEGVDILANKVVKFMMTSIGTDALDPAYGAYMPTYTQLSRRYLPRFEMEVQQDIGRCENYIKQAEEADYTDAFLSSITLLSVSFPSTTSTEVVDVEIEILATDGSGALLHLPVSLND